MGWHLKGRCLFRALIFAQLYLGYLLQLCFLNYIDYRFASIYDSMLITVYKALWYRAWLLEGPPVSHLPSIGMLELHTKMRLLPKIQMAPTLVIFSRVLKIWLLPRPLVRMKFASFSLFQLKFVFSAIFYFLLCCLFVFKYF